MSVINHRTAASAAEAPIDLQDDDALIAAWLRGNSQAFDLLVQRHGGPVFGFLRRMLGDEQLAEDAYAETFLRLVRARERYEGHGTFRAWLFTVARRCALDASRGRRRARNLGLKLVEAGANEAVGPDGERQVLAEQRKNLLDRAMADLPEEHRTALLLTYRYDLDTRELAHVLGLQEQQVRDRLAYARRKLREALADASWV
jgi:RNA polymerase sigma-70 factor (ECF subfamily)